MTKRYDTAYFIERARKVHGNKYDYSKSIYKNATSKVVITCHKHGDFLQIPSGHLSGKGCAKCSGKAKKTKDDFVRDARKVHGSKYDYSLVEYKNNKKSVTIICPVHGEFEQAPLTHTLGGECAACKGVKRGDTDSFKRKAEVIHGSTYSYAKVEYLNNKSPITIICKKHGEFEQLPNKHLLGQGCSDCARALMGRGANCFENICNAKKDSKPKLYVMKCSSGNEAFYKVGITSRGLKERYTGQVHMPYDYEVVHRVYGSSRFIYELERTVKGILRKYRFEPSKKFGGHTECFTTIKPIEKLLKELSTTEQLQLLA